MDVQFRLILDLKINESYSSLNVALDSYNKLNHPLDNVLDYDK